MVLLLLIVVVYALLFVRMTLIWHRIRYERVAPAFVPATRVTVLVPARNEIHHIEACLSGILQQNYPQHLLQVIVVDDNSTDDTHRILRQMEKENPQLLALSLSSAGKAGKKAALTYGIEQASGDLMLCTDADCTHEPDWIRTMVHHYEKRGHEFIAGPVRMNFSNNLLDVLQALDFTTMQGITATGISSRQLYMCNGANLAYTRKLFTAVNGFKGIDTLPTGDDMLLMQKVVQYNASLIGVVKNRSAIVSTRGCNTWSEFFQQRIRWASKAEAFERGNMFSTLLAVYVFNAMLLLSLVYAFLVPAHLPFVLAMFMVKTAGELFFLLPLTRYFKMKGLLRWHPVLQLHHVVYVLIAGWFGKFGKYRWKGRVIEKKDLAV